jgi:hypothetical protein
VTRRPLAIGLLAAASTIAVLAVAAPVDAAHRPPRPKVELSSTSGTFADASGGALVTAEMDGTPFAGRATATLTADDGTLPAPGDCEPATVSFHLDGPGRRFVDAEASGEVCGEFVQLPYITIQAFTGRYDVLDSTRRRIEGTDGFLEVRLGDDGSASLFLIDT